MKYLMFTYVEPASGKPRITMIEDFFKGSQPVVSSPDKPEMSP